MARRRISRHALGVLGVAFFTYMAFTLALNLSLASRARAVIFRTWVKDLEQLGVMATCDAAPERFSLPHGDVASMVVVAPDGRPFDRRLPPPPSWPTDLEPGEIRDLRGTWREARWIAAMDSGRSGNCRYFLLFGTAYNFQTPAETAVNLGLRLGAILALLGVIWGLVVRPIVARVRQMAGATTQIVAADFLGEVPAVGDDELTDLAAAFNHATAAARERLALLVERDQLTRQVVADIAHDVRTPLAALNIGIGRLIAERPLGPDEAAVLSELCYLEALIANLSNLAQLKGTRLPDVRWPVELGALTARVVSRFRLLASARGVQIHDAIPTRPLELLGDPVAVEQALANLVHNAVEFARGNTAVLCYREAGVAVLEVRDDGPGVSVTELARLRERYFRGAGESARGRKGQGLGLAIADEVARRHGGALEIGPDPDGGTRAVMRLPLEQPPRSESPGRADTPGHD